MFNQQELQVLLGGVNTPIDIEDLRRHTNYGGLFDDEESTIGMFWKVSYACHILSCCAIYGIILQVVKGFDAEQRRALLRFVTSVGRPPLLYAAAAYIIMR
jgi:ubiquitin-protein ligase E3 C